MSTTSFMVYEYLSHFKQFFNLQKNTPENIVTGESSILVREGNDRRNISKKNYLHDMRPFRRFQNHNHEDLCPK